MVKTFKKFPKKHFQNFEIKTLDLSFNSTNYCLNLQPWKMSASLPLLQKTSKKEAESKALELLNYLGLKERIHHKPSELSGGEQQRVAVARALVNKPAVIFADEPSGNLDSKSAESLHHLFLKLREELGQTFVIVTHNKKLAKMADRTLEMRDGKIVADSSFKL